MVVNQSSQEAKENFITIIESQKIICDRYTDICRIDKDAGDGSFSLVFKAKDGNSHINPLKQKQVALKFFNPACADQYRQDCFNRESDILRDLKGQSNILPLIQDKTNFQITLEYNGMQLPYTFMFYSSELALNNIRNYIYNNETKALTNIIFFREICKAVQRIHNKGICHRDLKPGNFLVYGDSYVCLSDFGTARYLGQKGGHIRDYDYYGAPPGDMRYTAPELLCGLHFSDEHSLYADIYSLGTILFELFAKTILSQNIFRGNEMMEILAYFHQTDQKDRIEIFDSFIEGFAKDKKLPSIILFDDTIPKVIVHEVDSLYQSLAALDYRNRLRDFQRIFLKINICEKVIKNRFKIEKWKHNY